MAAGTRAGHDHIVGDHDVGRCLLGAIGPELNRVGMINSRRTEIPEIIAVNEHILDGREFHTVNAEVMELVTLNRHTRCRHRAHANREMGEIAIRHRHRGAVADKKATAEKLVIRTRREEAYPFERDVF